MFVYNPKNTQVHESRNGGGQSPHSYKLDNIKVSSFYKSMDGFLKKFEMGSQAPHYASYSSQLRTENIHAVKKNSGI